MNNSIKSIFEPKNTAVFTDFMKLYKPYDLYIDDDYLHDAINRYIQTDFHELAPALHALGLDIDNLAVTKEIIKFLKIAEETEAKVSKLKRRKILSFISFNLKYKINNNLKIMESELFKIDLLVADVIITHHYLSYKEKNNLEWTRVICKMIRYIIE